MLKEDYYSLAFYGFFLDSEQEELSAHKHSHKANEILKSRKTEKSDGQALEVVDADPKDTASKGINDWILKSIMQHRTKRNSKNTYKVMLIFCIQFTLLFCIAYGLVIGKILNEEFLYVETADDEEEVE